jgi:asparagine synthase (glutamine-hydrolysing)
MTRALAGVVHAHAGPRRDCARALAPHAARALSDGPLDLAYTGPPCPEGELVCLLDGFLDNAGELAGVLALAPRPPVERLLAHGWQRWGTELPARMRGDFVLLVWDRRSRTGLLARDQMGARPLFVHERSGTLSFAGEMRQLLALLDRRPAPDHAGIAHWLAMSNRPGPGTLFAGVRRLDPGTSLVLGEHGVRAERYWTPRYAEPLQASREELAALAREALERSVARRLDSAGVTGVLMSGGLDSGSVAALAARQAPGRVRAYSAVFPEHASVDESELIDELRRALGLAGANAQVRSGGLLASAIEAVDAWALPLRSWGDFWALPLLRAAAAEGVHTVLGGDGGDELFGVRAHLLADAVRAGHPLLASRLARELPGAGDRPSRRQLAAIVLDVGLVGALPRSLQKPALRARGDTAPPWFTPALARALRESQAPLAWLGLEGPRWWASVAHGLTRGVEEAGVFEYGRRRAAAAGLRTRQPLLDLDLVELALRMPPRASFDRHRTRPLLRAAMAGALPDAVRLRAGKARFDALVIDTLSGPDAAAIRALLCDRRAELAAHVDLPAAVRALLGEDRLRREQPFRWMSQLWRMTALEVWLRAEAAGGSAGAVGQRPDAGPARVRICPAGARETAPAARASLSV